jgi:hypothetical protein
MSGRLVTFAIGNSDDKLSQAVWSNFVHEVIAVVDLVTLNGARVQFAGYSPPGAPWQNALWAIEIPPTDPDLEQVLRARLSGLVGPYRQDSIAWWVTDQVEFLEPAS